MRSAKDILKELGFNPSAPDSTKNAFLKNLKKAAQENQKAEVIEPSFKSTVTIEEKKSSEQQLSFDLELLGPKTDVRLKVGS